MKGRMKTMKAFHQHRAHSPPGSNETSECRYSLDGITTLTGSILCCIEIASLVGRRRPGEGGKKTDGSVKERSVRQRKQLLVTAAGVMDTCSVHGITGIDMEKITHTSRLVVMYRRLELHRWFLIFEVWFTDKLQNQ